MGNLFIRTGLFSISILAFAYIPTLFIPQFQSLGNDKTPMVPTFCSTRIPNEFVKNSDFDKFDQQMNQFIQKWGISGMSLAIAKDDKLIYTKGYGYADKEAEELVQPYNLFRVASVSKLITAVGIMKLVEGGNISLESKVFGPNGILNDSIYLNYKDPRVEEITVKQLLEHSAGWTPRYGDHMFMPSVVATKLKKPLPVNVSDIIQFALMHRLHFQPGSVSSYSNLGYAVLGSVIEKVSGVSHEEYIKVNVLIPLGIYDACIGNSYLSERKELEVRYYEAGASSLVEDYRGSGQMVPRIYGGNDIQTLGAAGGWIASSTDLLKLMVAINGNDNFRDILSQESISQMVGSIDNTKSPLGWRRINEREWVRTGTLASTSALMVHRYDNISYVIITNTGNWKGSDFTIELERQMNKSILGFNNWPSYNLFNYDISYMEPLKSLDAIVE